MVGGHQLCVRERGNLCIPSELCVIKTNLFKFKVCEAFSLFTNVLHEFLCHRLLNFTPKDDRRLFSLFIGDFFSFMFTLSLPVSVLVLHIQLYF